jgi:hypothetical protein
MADKADWRDANLRHFIDICKGEILAGNRPLGFIGKILYLSMKKKRVRC